MNPLDAHQQAAAQLRSSIPGLSEDNPLFRAPWQTRVFALVVALVQQGHFSWTTFQSRLAVLVTKTEKQKHATSAAAVEGLYFNCWLQAIEETLESQGMLSARDIDQRIAVVRETVKEIRAAQSGS